jgi:hypothetical protein
MISAIYHKLEVSVGMWAYILGTFNSMHNSSGRIESEFVLRHKHLRITQIVILSFKYEIEMQQL